MRAKSINSAWWLTIPKGEKVAVMDKPTDSPPLVALAKWILPNPDKVDQALIEAWYILLKKNFSPTPTPTPTPTPNSSQTNKIPGFIPIPDLTEEKKTEAGVLLAKMGELFGWLSEDEEIIKQRLGLEGGE